MIKNVLVLGAGSAGLLAAISVKVKIPQISVRIVRSPDIGVIGVGEGTTPNFPAHLFDYLKINKRRFYEMAQPTWKLGIHFIWGPRGSFNYAFDHALDTHWSDLPRPNGFYCDDEFSCNDLPTALMTHGKCWAQQPNGGGPDIQGWHGFHIENKKLVDVLEIVAKGVGVEFIDAKVSGATKLSDGEGIKSVHLEDGRTLEADFFVDASGFRSELLGKALAEPYISFSNSLFCDRACVGGWERTDEPILPYTTAENMDAGWAWRIEHEFHVNRGYVYCSSAISDEAARDEYCRKNPRAPKEPRIVKFKSGRYARGWVGNVVAIGNSVGFVEPLEATALMVVCAQCRTMVDFLIHTALRPTPTIRSLYNQLAADVWDEIRDFLALHYKLNTQIDNDFWRHCNNDTDVSGITDLLAFYRENGPTGFGRHLLKATGSNFGIEGFLTMFVGNKMPYNARHQPTEREMQMWNQRRAEFSAKAKVGMDVKDSLACIRRPEWRWFGE